MAYGTMGELVPNFQPLVKIECNHYIIAYHINTFSHV